MKFALALILFAGFAAAQTPIQNPDCSPITFTLTGGNGNSPTLPNPYYDNRSTQCVTWTVAYEADAGLSGYTVAFQSATGSITPAAFGAYTGNTVNSSPSFGTAALGIATYCSLATCSMGGSTVNTPWLRVHVSGATGTGNIRGVWYGYRTGATGGTGGAGGGGGGTGCPNPCPVEGVDAAGAAPTVPPVATAGFDGTDNRRISTDSSGRQIAVGGAASGAVEVGNPVPVAGNDGTDVRTLKTDTAGDLSTFQIGLGTFLTGSQTVLNTPAVLPTNAAKSVCVHALIANTLSVFAGPAGVSTSTGMEIPPGQGFCWNLSNSNLVNVVASFSTGNVITWSVTN